MSNRWTIRWWLLLSGVLLFSSPLVVANAAEWQVRMLDHTYNPAELNITVGDTVTWKNVEPHDDDHTVTSHPEKDPDGPLDSGLIQPNQSFSFTFTEAGNFPYYCAVHGREMSGIVRVRPAGAPFAVDDKMTAAKDRDGSDPATGSINVLRNDFDPDNPQDLRVVEFDAVTTRGASIVCSESGLCTYTDVDAPCGAQDAFGYTISDGTQRDSAQVAVAVACGATSEASESQVSLRLRRHLVGRGEVVSEARACARGRRVTIQRSTSGGWKTVASDRTSRDGSYSTRVRDRAGTYRAKASSKVLDTGQRCKSDVSPSRRHAH